MPAGPMTETRRARRSRDGRMEQVLEQAQLVVAADERRLERVRRGLPPPRSATTRSARQAGTGLALPLSTCSPAARRRWPRDAARWVASPTRTVPGRPPPIWSRRRGVDEVARDHALVRGAERHGGLAGQDARPRRDARAQRPDRVDELERGSHRALGVVLVGDRCTPDRHHRIADELLDGAAVAVDDVARQVEVARQQLPGVLGVATFGERREAHEVGEQDRDDAALGDGSGVERPRTAAVASTGLRRRSSRVGTRTRRRTSHRPRSGHRTRDRPPRGGLRTPSRTCVRPDSQYRSWCRSRGIPG